MLGTAWEYGSRIMDIEGSRASRSDLGLTLRARRRVARLWRGSEG